MSPSTCSASFFVINGTLQKQISFIKLKIIYAQYFRITHWCEWKTKANALSYVSNAAFAFSQQNNTQITSIASYQDVREAAPWTWSQQHGAGEWRGQGRGVAWWSHSRQDGAWFCSSYSSAAIHCYLHQNLDYLIHFDVCFSLNKHLRGNWYSVEGGGGLVFREPSGKGEKAAEILSKDGSSHGLQSREQWSSGGRSETRLDPEGCAGVWVSAWVPAASPCYVCTKTKHRCAGVSAKSGMSSPLQRETPQWFYT